MWGSQDRVLRENAAYQEVLAGVCRCTLDRFDFPVARVLEELPVVLGKNNERDLSLCKVLLINQVLVTGDEEVEAFILGGVE